MKDATTATAPAQSQSFPERLFTRPLSATDALIPLAIGAIVGLVVTVAMQPYVEFALLKTMPPEAAARLTEGPLRWMSQVGVLVITFVRAALYAGLALLVLRAANDGPRFAAVLVCSAWAQLILVLKGIAQYVIVAASGTETIHSTSDLAPGTGLGFIAGSNESMLYRVLELVNGFDIAFIAAFALSMRLATRCPLPLTVTAALVPWLLFSALEIALSAITPR